MPSPKPHAHASSRPDNRVYRVAGFALLFLILATIVFVFVKTLVFDQPISDRALRQALVAASVGATLSCLIAWILDLLELVELRPGWSKLLWTVLVTSILASSALAYRQFAVGANTTALSVVCVRPVATDDSTRKVSDPITVLNQERHKTGGVFAFIVTLRNVQTDSNGDYRVDLRYEFDDGGHAAFQQVKYSGNAKKLKADPADRKRLDVYRKALPDCVDEKTVEMLVLSDLQPIDQRSAIHELALVAYDDVGKDFARATLSVATFGPPLN